MYIPLRGRAKLQFLVTAVVILLGLVMLPTRSFAQG
jgi:hypothetical protein